MRISTRRHRRTAPLLLVATATLLGCGGSHAPQETAAGSRPAATASNPLGEQAVREVVRLRTAGSDAAELYRRIIDVIRSAGGQGPDEGTRILRTDLVALLDEAAIVWPRVGRAIGAETPKSRVGRGQRAVLLRGTQAEQASLARLRRELGRSSSPWAAVIGFIKRTNDLHRDLTGELHELMAAIPAYERSALRRAFEDRS